MCWVTLSRKNTRIGSSFTADVKLFSVFVGKGIPYTFKLYMRLPI
jgi:hypothetical protein